MPSLLLPQNADIVEYRTATGLEALIGYLYLSGQTDRMLELLSPILSGHEDIDKRP